MASSYRNIEICQQVEFLPGKDISFIKKVLENDKRITKYAYILHDKDKKEDGTAKPSHYHIMLSFKSPLILSTICKMFNEKIPEQYFNKISGTWGTALSYLTHSNAPGKYQYSKEEVVANFQWEVEAETSKSQLNDILAKIISGEIRQYNYTKYIDGFTYIKYKKQIEDAFKYRLDVIKEEVDRDMKCIYIYGGSGTGKTTYAKHLAEEKGYSFFISSGSNDVLDGYEGQDCLILDDLRPSCLGLSDLLKLLDNNTSSSVKSRYKNKVLECKLVIITTTLNINDFFKNVFSEQPETCIQLKRRCQTVIKFGNNITDNLKLYAFDGNSNYDLIGEMVNPLKTLYKQRPITVKETLNLLCVNPNDFIPVKTDPDADDAQLPF